MSRTRDGDDLHQPEQSGEIRKALNGYCAAYSIVNIHGVPSGIVSSFREESKFHILVIQSRDPTRFRSPSRLLPPCHYAMLKQNAR